MYGTDFEIKFFQIHKPPGRLFDNVEYVLGHVRVQYNVDLILQDKKLRKVMSGVP